MGNRSNLPSWQRFGLCLIISSALAACGGGGGGASTDSTSKTSGTVTTTNYQKVGTTAAAASAGLNETKNLASDGTNYADSKGLVTDKPKPQDSLVTEAPANLSSSYFASKARAVLDKARTQSNFPFGSGKQLYTDTDYCEVGNTSSGTLVVTISIANQNALSAGDWVQLQYTNCRFSQSSTSTINGTFRMTFNQVSGSAETLEMRFTNLRVIKTDGSVLAGYNGTVTMSATATTYTVTYNAFEVARGSEVHTYNLRAVMDISTTPPQISISQDILVDGKYYTVTTTESLQMPSSASHPNSGKMKVTGSGGSYTTVNMDDKNVTTSFHPDGSATAVATTTSSWDEVLNTK